MSNATMKAVVPRTSGGPEVLQLVERPMPDPGAGQLLIRVAFAGINRHDAGQRSRGSAPPGAIDVLGLEVAGEVIAVGDGVPQERLGEQVCALVDGGGYATHCIADAGLTLPFPGGLSEPEAAAAPEALFTCWLNLMELGRLAAGEWLLVHGGAGGVGSIAIQIGKLIGCKVLATASNREKCDACLRLGAERAINYKDEDFVAVVNEATSSRGADVILDIAGGLYAERNLKSLARDGRIVHLSSGGSAAVFSASLRLIMSKRARVTGSLLRPLPLSEKLEIASEVRRSFWPRLGEGIRPHVDSVFRLDAAVEAHRKLESNQHIGKIVLACR